MKGFTRLLEFIALLVLIACFVLGTLASLIISGILDMSISGLLGDICNYCYYIFMLPLDLVTRGMNLGDIYNVITLIIPAVLAIWGLIGFILLIVEVAKHQTYGTRKAPKVFRIIYYIILLALGAIASYVLLADFKMEITNTVSIFILSFTALNLLLTIFGIIACAKTKRLE